MISEDAIEQRPSTKKRILVGSFLAMAAMGTHWLPGRTIVASEVEPQKCAIATPVKMMPTGPNSLLGDVVADKTTLVLAGATEMSQYHLDVDSASDQAGLTQFLKGVAPLSNEPALTGNDSAPQANAIPEPGMSGLFLLTAAPVLIRRKGRPAAQA